MSRVEFFGREWMGDEIEHAHATAESRLLSIRAARAAKIATATNGLRVMRIEELEAENLRLRGLLFEALALVTEPSAWAAAQSIRMRSRR